MELSLQKSLRPAAGLSIGGLCLLLILLVFPVTSSEVEAASQQLVNSEGYSSVSVGLGSSSLDLDITPDADIKVKQTRTSLQIKTKNVESYEVYVQALKGEERLVNSSWPNGAAIESIGKGPIIVKDMPVNTWGVGVSARTNEVVVYNVPKTAKMVLSKTTDNTEQTDNYNISLLAKIDSTLPAGTYKGGVIISVLAKFKEEPKPATMENIIYMQDITPELCTNSKLEKAYVLIDQRDNQPYTVKKMKDNNCWMTENLALTAPNGGKVLTPADSDVTSNWMLAETRTSAMSWPDDSRIAASVNLSNGYGTYFTWCGATAGTCNSATADGVIVTGSVCPKGWRLPLAGSKYDGTSGSFYYLLDQYTKIGTNGIFLPESIKVDILNFQYGGIIGEAGSLNFAGSTGYFWSSAAKGNIDENLPTAYRLIIHSALDFEPSASAVTNAGHSVRCLAR